MQATERKSSVVSVAALVRQNNLKRQTMWLKEIKQLAASLDANQKDDDLRLSRVKSRLGGSLKG